MLRAQVKGGGEGDGGGVKRGKGRGGCSDKSRLCDIDKTIGLCPWNKANEETSVELLIFVDAILLLTMQQNYFLSRCKKQ